MDLGRQIRALATELVEQFSHDNQRLIIAESCTGGMISSAIISVENCSNMFEGGIVAYSNDLKQKLLGVSDAEITKYGAVSKQIANQMAVGALAISNANIALAITGIAGPNGGSLDKPVGTVFICILNRFDRIFELQLLLNGDRNNIRQKSVHLAFEKIIEIRFDSVG